MSSAPLLLVSRNLALKSVPGNQNSFLVKRKTGGGIQFSRDPYNLMNVHSRKVPFLTSRLSEEKLIHYSMPDLSTTE